MLHTLLAGWPLWTNTDRLVLAENYQVWKPFQLSILHIFLILFRRRLKAWLRVQQEDVSGHSVFVTVIEGSSVSGHSLLNWPQEVSWPPAEDKQRTAGTQIEDREATSRGHGDHIKITEMPKKLYLLKPWIWQTKDSRDTTRWQGGLKPRTWTQAEDREATSKIQGGHKQRKERQHPDDLTVI